MTIAAERIKPCGAVAAGMRILGSERGTNGVRLAALIPASYTAVSPERCRIEVRELSHLADLAAVGRTGQVTLSDDSRIVTRYL